MLSTFLQTVFWILFVAYGISRIMMNTGIRLFIILEDILLIPFAISIPITACVVLEWISNKSVETFITIAGLIIIAIVVIFQIYKKSLELSFGSDEQLNRSKKKSKIMRSAFIKYNSQPVSNSFDALVAHKEECLRELYDFLLNDEILSPLMKQFTYDEFYNYVFEIEMMGLGYAKDGNFIPISSFCFIQPLGAVLAYREGHIDRDSLRGVLSEYFK